MMKSFFKKLSLVMALAMVVSLVAPAGSALADEAGIALQGTKKVVTDYSVEVGEEVVDFCFLGAPADWKTTFAWTSDNEDVATVDKAGKVTALKDGVANITITAGADGAYKHTVKVTVGKGEVADNSFEVKQTSDSTAELTFNNKDITAADLATLRFYYYIGETQITYPFKLGEVKNGVVTVTSYVTFADSVKYGFECAGEKDEFVASIGDVAAIIPSFKSDGDENHAYATKETDVNYKLINAKGIDITASALAKGGYVEFSFVEESEDGEFWFNDPVEGKVYFDKEGAVANVMIKYFTGKYDEVTYDPIVGATAITTLVSEKPVGFSVDVTATPIVAIEKNSDGIDWSKASNVIALEDDQFATYKLVVQLKSNKGEKVYTTDTKYGQFTFASTNNAKLYVDEYGTLMTNAQGVTNVLVYFQPSGATTKSVVAVVAVDVRAKRAVTTMTTNTTSVTVSTKTGYDTADITVELKDQLQKGIPGTIEVNAITKVPNGATRVPDISFTNNGTSKITINVDAGTENLPPTANSYQYTYSIKCGKITKNFTVNVRRPDDKVSGYKLEFGGDSDIKTTGDVAKFASATLYAMSNGVKNDVVTLTGAKKNASDAIEGLYYYTVTKDGKDLKLDGTTSELSMQLTKMDTVSASGSAIDGIKVVNKGANGTGTYTVVVYQAVGTTKGATASSFRQVARGSVTVKDTQDTMSYLGKVKNTTTATTVENLVKECFQFKIGNTVLETKNDGTDNYGTTLIDVKANVPDGGLTSGAICFVKSVDFYVLVGTDTYVKYTVNVNDYVEVQ